MGRDHSLLVSQTKKGTGVTMLLTDKDIPGAWEAISGDAPPLLMAAYADIEVWVGEELRVHHVDGSCSELINTVMSKRLLAARPGGAYKLTDNEFEWLRSNYSAFWDYIALVDETKGGKE